MKQAADFVCHMYWYIENRCRSCLFIIIILLLVWLSHRLNGGVLDPLGFSFGVILIHCGVADYCSALLRSFVKPTWAQVRVDEWLNIHTALIERMRSVHGSNPPHFCVNAAFLSSCPTEWLKHDIQTCLLLLQLKRIVGNQSLVLTNLSA